MATEAKILAHDLGQPFALGPVRRVAGRAALFRKRLMGVTRTGLLLDLCMAADAETDLGLLEQFRGQGAVGHVTGQAPVRLERQMEGSGPRQLLADVVMTG